MSEEGSERLIAEFYRMSCIFRSRQLLRSSVRSHNTLPTYHKRELPSSLIALSSLQGIFITHSLTLTHQRTRLFIQVDYYSRNHWMKEEWNRIFHYLNNL